MWNGEVFTTCCALDLSGSPARHTNAMQAPGPNTVAAITWISFTMGWRSQIMGYGPFPVLRLCNVCQHQTLIIVPYLSLQTFCALVGRVCHCGALTVLVRL